LEGPERRQLSAELAARVELAVPSAALLLEAWWAKSVGARVELRKKPPEPFYLRPPHITVAGERAADGARIT
jgi:hypothetical protein